MKGEFLANGVWFCAPDRSPGAAGGRPGIVLDRDGVLVEEIGYLHRPQDVRLLDGAAAFVAEANHREIPVVVATNQAGIARRMFGWSEFFETQNEVARQLAAQGAVVDGVIACPFHPDFTKGWGEDHALWRKPGSGMMSLAAERLGLDLPMSWVVGDTSSEVAAGLNAGMAGAVHVLTGHGMEHREKALDYAQADFELVEANSIGDAFAIFERF